MNNTRPHRSLWSVLGPGLIFAAAAVGVSHLVQSTRAGAVFGLAMFGFILFANAMKYPAFRFGPHYAAATGLSLLEGYRRRGRWALVLYAIVTLSTMFTVQAAVTFVTAGLFKATLGLQTSPVWLSAGILATCVALLGLGKYAWLDRITKVLIVVLTVSTIAATIAVLPKIAWSGSWWVSDFDMPTLFFVAALIGWMPSAIDVSVWNSLWTLAKGNDLGERVTGREALLDFHIGYLGTALLAICFMLLGAGVMHGSGVEFSSSAGGFAAQVIDLYKVALGDWAGPLIGVSAFAVMFSTTLAVIDGFPRAIATLVARFRGPEDTKVFEMEDATTRRTYWVTMLVLAVGAVVVIAAFLSSLRTMVDLATTLSFLTAPVLAFLNHKAITGDEVPEAQRPSRILLIYSATGIVLMSAFALGYIALRLSG